MRALLSSSPPRPRSPAPRARRRGRRAASPRAGAGRSGAATSTSRRRSQRTSPSTRARGAARGSSRPGPRNPRGTKRWSWKRRRRRPGRSAAGRRRRRSSPPAASCCGGRRRPRPSRRRRRRAGEWPRGGAAKKPAAPTKTRAAAKTLADAPPAFAEGDPAVGAAWSDFLGAAAARRLVADGFERPTAAQSALGAALADGAAPRDVVCWPRRRAAASLAYLLRTLADADGPGGVLVVAPGRELAVQIDRVARAALPRRVLARSSAARTEAAGRGAAEGEAGAGRGHARPPSRSSPSRGAGPLKLGKLRWCVVDECDHALARPPFGEDVEALARGAPAVVRRRRSPATYAALLGDEGAPRGGPGRRCASTRRRRGARASRPIGIAAKIARHGRLRAKARSARGACCGPRPRPARRRSSSSRTRRPPRPSRRGSRPRASTRARSSATQTRRTRAAAVRHLNEGAAPAVVVATEGAARGGLDCPRVTHVVNYLSAPSSASHYAGRAGPRGPRAGHAGLRPLGRGRRGRGRVPQGARRARPGL